MCVVSCQNARRFAEPSSPETGVRRIVTTTDKKDLQENAGLAASSVASGVAHQVRAQAGRFSWLSAVVALVCASLLYFDSHHAILLPGLAVIATVLVIIRAPVRYFTLFALAFFVGRTIDAFLPQVVRGIAPLLLGASFFVVLLPQECRLSLALPVRKHWLLWAIPFAVACMLAMHWWFEAHAPLRLLPSLRRQAASVLWTVMPPALILNAIGEEVVFRGAFLSALLNAHGRSFSIVVQAVAFGLVHYVGGIPNGLAGCLMAFAFGLGLGLFRVMTQSLWPGIAIHAAVGVFMGIRIVQANVCWFCR